MLISSVSFSECSRWRRPRTLSTSRLGGSPSSTSSGLHLPLGQQQSSSVPCFSLLCYSAAGSAPSISERAGPVMASCSTFSDPRVAALPSPCPNPGSSLAESSLHGSLALPSHSPLCILTHPDGCGPPPAGPPFPRPKSRMTGSSPGCHIRSFHPFCATAASSTTLQPFRAAVETSFNTAPAPVSTMTGERTPAASSSWIHPQGHEVPLPLAVWSRSLNPLSQLSVTGPRGHSPARPPVPLSPRSRRNSVSAVVLNSGVDAFEEVRSA